jgi:hypothetical protein
MPDTPTHDRYGELASVRPESIPLGQAVSQAQFEELTRGDASPTQVVIRIGPGQSGGHHWHYTPSALRQLVEVVNSRSLPGYLGHGHAALPSSEWHDPLLHWVGARWDGSAALVRGVIDHSHARADDLKRWLRSGRLKAPSILTIPVVREYAGAQFVESLEHVLSIDMAGLGREGMRSASVIYSGETLDRGDDDVNESDAYRELVGISTLLGATGPETARQAVASLYHERADLRERVQKGIRAETMRLAQEKGAPQSDAGLVADATLGRLTARGVSDPTEEQLTVAVGETLTEYRRGRRVDPNYTDRVPHETGQRMGSGHPRPDMSLFATSAYRVEA